MSAGERFRQDYDAAYEPEHPGEGVILDRVLALLDQIAAMEDALERDGYVAAGGNGQPVASPLLPAIRAHSAEVSRLVRQLRMEPESITSTRARHAAEVRWAK